MDPESLFLDAVQEYPASSGQAFEDKSRKITVHNLEPWQRAFDNLGKVFAGEITENEWWDDLPPFSQQSQSAAQRVRSQMADKLSSSQVPSSAVNPFQGQTPFLASQGPVSAAGDDVRDSQLLNVRARPAQQPADVDEADPHNSEIHLIRSRNEMPRGLQDDYSDEYNSDESFETPPSAQPIRNSSPHLTPPSAQPIRSSSPHLTEQSAVAMFDPAVALASLASPQSHSQSHTGLQLQEAEDHNNTPTPTPWPLKTALSGTRAHHYRGPLTSQQVLLMLSSNISENGRKALTGSHAGYLQYYHFLGIGSVPTSLQRTKLGDRTEVWLCRLCHTHLRVPPTKISNLGAHLYGKQERSGWRPGCLDSRRDDPIEQIPAPDRNSAGELIHHRATKKISLSAK
ncbi:hypothetical protein CF326_g3212 [Tilletia indica]|nr:hypothetical protein CF326_g3212 [Tilletia indica]